MKLGSLFDGSGGFPLAGHLCGITPAFASEVEPYPIAVTTNRIPNMKHLGSVTDINGAEIEPVDIITFGSPCQDLSVAGKRAGLKHEANGDEETTRSGLFMEAVRIIKEMRRSTNGVYPNFAIWENVPGAFSSNGGEDFRVVLEELIKIVEPDATVPSPEKGKWPYADAYVGDGWSLAYRTLDAQYWGVPQRRRRIYLVLDLRGERAHKVLFEREGLRGYFEKGRAPWQGTAGNAENRPGADDREGAGNCLTPWDVQSRRVFTPDGAWPALYSGEGGGHGYVCCKKQAITLEPGIAAREGGHIYEGVSGTLRANAGDNQMAVAYGQSICCYDIGEARLRTPSEYVEQSPTITARCGTGGNNTPAVVMPSVVDQNILDDQGGSQIGVRTDGKSPTLRAEMHGNVPCVLEKEQHLFENHSQDTRYRGPLSVCPILSATLGMGGNNQPFVVEKQPCVYDGANVTSPINASNPQPGDPCHTLSTDSRNILVVPICCIDGDKIGKAERAGGSGLGIRPCDKMYTLTAKDAGTHSVCYTLSHGGFMVNPSDDGIADTLQASDYKDPQVVAIDRAAFNQGQNAQYNPQYYTDGTVPTLAARGPGAVAHKQEIRYIVRRLTPTECARLQGFPDRWGHITTKEDFTDEEYNFWLEVRNTHAAINGKTTKEYTKQQMLTWYNKLHTDSAEYKMWGNGIALPTALYVMQGIADALEREGGATE